MYVIDDSSDLNVQYEVFQDDGAGWQNTYSCEMMAKRSGKTMGDPAVYPANTCEDIQGTENRYTSFVNVPGILDIEIESIRAIYNKDLGDYDLKVGNIDDGYINFAVLIFTFDSLEFLHLKSSGHRRAIHSWIDQHVESTWLVP